MLDAIAFGQRANQEILDLQEQLIASVGRPKLEFEAARLRAEVKDEVKAALEGRLDELLAEREAYLARHPDGSCPGLRRPYTRPPGWNSRIHHHELTDRAA